MSKRPVTVGVVRPVIALRQQPVCSNSNRVQPKPIAPSVYNPQPLPRCLQLKTHTARPVIINQQNTIAPPVAPAVYRPDRRPKILQRKESTELRGPVTNPVTNKVIQRPPAPPV